MLDQFLQSFAAMMTPVMLTLTLNVLLHVGEGRDMPWSRYLRWWGFIAGVVMAVVVVVLRITLIVSRRSYSNYPVLILAIIADFLALGVVLLAQYSKDHRHERGKSWMIHASNAIAGLAIMTTTFYALQDVFLRLASWVETGDSPFTIAMLLRVLGFLFGIAVSFILAGIVSSLKQQEIRHSFILATIVMIAIALVRHVGAFLSLLMATQVVNLGDRLFDAMVAVNNHHLQLSVVQIAIYGIPAIASIILGIKMHQIAMGVTKRNHTHHKGSGNAITTTTGLQTVEDPSSAYVGLLQPEEAHRRVLQALYRKALAVGSWTIIIMSCSLSSLIVGLHYVNKAPMLSEPESYSLVQGVATIPFKQVSDGHLHRFEYKASDGTIMRFIVIKKHGGAFGLGLDACDICGPTGYYEKDGKIICIRCGVALNVATIGFKGGCNPIPFPFTVHNGVITIQAHDLDALSSHFKV